MCDFHFSHLKNTHSVKGWSGVAKVSCILRHWGIQLIFAHSWARPAIIVAGKCKAEIFIFLMFLHFHSGSSFFPVPLFHLLFYLFFPFLWDDTKWHVVKPQHSQSTQSVNSVKRKQLDSLHMVTSHVFMFALSPLFFFFLQTIKKIMFHPSVSLRPSTSNFSRLSTSQVKWNSKWVFS